MGREAGVFYKRLAENIAAKRNVPTSTMINWIRTRVNYHLIRSCLLCLRGSRSWKTVFETVRDTDINLVNFECNMAKNELKKEFLFFIFLIFFILSTPEIHIHAHKNINLYNIFPVNCGPGQ